MLLCQFALLVYFVSPLHMPLDCEDKQNKGQMPSYLFKTTKYSMNKNIIFVIFLELAIHLIYKYGKHIIVASDGFDYGLLVLKKITNNIRSYKKRFEPQRLYRYNSIQYKLYSLFTTFTYCSF